MKTDLRVTTVEAYSLLLEAVTGLYAKVPHTPIVDEIGVFHNDAGKWSGYIHGTAEAAAGFDIPRFISGTLPAVEDELECVLVLPDREISCIMIQWKPVSESVMWDYRALICAVDDQKALAYARKCAQEKTNYL